MRSFAGRLRCVAVAACDGAAPVAGAVVSGRCDRGAGAERVRGERAGAACRVGAVVRRPAGGGPGGAVAGGGGGAAAPGGRRAGGAGRSCRRTMWCGPNCWGGCAARCWTGPVAGRGGWACGGWEAAASRCWRPRWCRIPRCAAGFPMGWRGCGWSRFRVIRRRGGPCWHSRCLGERGERGERGGGQRGRADGGQRRQRRDGAGVGPGRGRRAAGAHRPRRPGERGGGQRGRADRGQRQR